MFTLLQRPNAARTAGYPTGRLFKSAALVLGALALGACSKQPQLVWEPLPRNVLVADVSAAFTVEGKGSSRELTLPKEKSILSRPDAKELLLFRITKENLEPLPFSIAKDRLVGDFKAGERYLLHVPLSTGVKAKYVLFCGMKKIHTRLSPGTIDPLCTQILCPSQPFFADALLDQFPELQKFSDEFPRDELKQLEIGPAPKDFGGDFPQPGLGGNICDQCTGQAWDFVLVPTECLPLPSSKPPCWSARGPGPNTLGQVENITNGEVVGAINAVAPHPTDSDIVFAGGVNGGIWRTGNASAANPNWTRQTDAAESLSIGALEFDPTDTTNQTLVAGIGRFSSFGRRGGNLAGLLRTTDGGANWTAIDGGGTLRGLNISGIAPRGGTIVISVNDATVLANRGVWRSTDTGVTWTRISGGADTGLPAGPAFDLASDPGNAARLFTNAGTAGLFRSDDTGATWTATGSNAMNVLVRNAYNVEFSVGASDNVYVAIVQDGGVNAQGISNPDVSGVFRSGDGGTNWTAMDRPATADGGLHPGGQGDTHLSIAADRLNENIVYLGGDRQAQSAGAFPNAIGANDFSGLLFRGDASQPAGSQFTPLTHSGTRNNSAPHADSRDMDMAANGSLIEADDGGIYRRSSPADNTGDWFSMNGNIQTTELHDVAWDSNANIIIGGAQDTGTPEQRAAANLTWQSVATADGGDVAVDDTSTAGFSTRFSSNQRLRNFRRRVFDSSNVLQSDTLPALTVLDNGAALQRQFLTPIKLNNVDPTRLIIGGSNSVYESLDQGDTITEIGPGIVANGSSSSASDPIAYGATGNADMLYVGSGAQVFIRSAAAPAALTASAAYTGGTVVDIAIDPADPNRAFVVDPDQVFFTTDGGAAWTDATGNLGALNVGTIRSLAFRDTRHAAIIGTDIGVFIADGPNFNNWQRLGECLPRVPVYDLDYDSVDQMLIAGTLGRGAWLLHTQ